MARFFAGLVYQAHFIGAELDEATRMRMQQREYYLSWKMIQMLQDLQGQRIQLQTIQEQSAFAWGALLCTALQQWQFWVIAAVLVLLCELCWWLSRRSHQPASSSKHSGSRRLEKEEEEGSLHMDSFLDEYMSWRVPKRKVACRVVETLAKELIRVCQKLSKNDFMPRLQAPVGLGGFQEDVDPQGEEQYVYLVPLEPPPGHSFHLELSTEGEMPVRNSRLRVQLECTCSEDQQPGYMLCFLHYSEDQPTSMQEASLLQTLCTGPYLDLQKTTLWLQELMKAACTLVPYTDTYKLTVLASRRYCRIKVTSIFKNSRSIELVLGVQHGDSGTFVCLE